MLTVQHIVTPNRESAIEEIITEIQTGSGENPQQEAHTSKTIK